MCLDSILQIIEKKNNLLRNIEGLASNDNVVL